MNYLVCDTIVMKIKKPGLFTSHSTAIKIKQNSLYSVTYRFQNKEIMLFVMKIYSARKLF